MGPGAWDDLWTTPISKWKTIHIFETYDKRIGTVTATNFSGLLNSKDISDLDSLVGFDFGNMDGNINNILEWVESFNPVNMGTFTAPATQNINLGSI